MISTYSFFDELDKIAASKWRTLLRAGQLNPLSRLRLMGAQRPGGGALLDPVREAAGLERGTTNLAQRMGATLHTTTPESMKANLKGVLTEPVASLKRLGHDVVGMGVAPKGGGAAAMAPLNVAYFTPQHSIVQAAGDSPALTALIRRHEVDELRAFQHAQKKGINRVFVPGVVPEGAAGKALAQKQGRLRRVYSGVAGIAERVKGSKLPKPIKSVAGEIGESARALESSQPRPGMIATGKHMSPFPVVQESGHTQFLPSDVAERMSEFRRGENTVLGPYGFQYGTRAGNTQQILRDFAAGRL